jgi:hypothetical protein
MILKGAIIPFPALTSAFWIHRCADLAGCG